MEEPLLFIQTIEVESVLVKAVEVETVEVQPIEEEVHYLSEESTSVYELSRTERIKDPVIARQLNYFLQPVNQHRLLAFHLVNGNEIIGKIEEIIGPEVKIKGNDQDMFINANDIKAITTKK